MQPPDQELNPRFAVITENISIPIPSGLSPDQEAQFVAQYVRDHDIAAMESEYLAFAKEIEQGNLIPAETVLRELK
jgi:hypothetical protein